MRWFWRIMGCAAVAVGAAGVFVPLLPTTPFLLAAAWAFARSSDRLYCWLVNHPRFGPAIRDWRERRAIPRRAKGVALVSLLASLAITLVLQLPSMVVAIQTTAVIAVSAFLLSLPSTEGPAAAASVDAGTKENGHETAPIDGKGDRPGRS